MNYFSKVIAFTLLLFFLSCSKDSSIIQSEKENLFPTSQNQNAKIRDNVPCYSCSITHHVQEPKLSKACRKYKVSTLGNTLFVSLIDSDIIIQSFLSLTDLLGNPIVPSSVSISDNQIILQIPPQLIETIIEIGYVLKFDFCEGEKEPTGICKYQTSGLAGFIEQQVLIDGESYLLCTEQLCFKIGENSLGRFVEVNSYSLALCFTPSAFMIHGSVCQEIQPIGTSFLNFPDGKKAIRFFFDEGFWDCVDDSGNGTFEFFIEHANPFL